MNTLATKAIDWDMQAGYVEMGSNRLLFAKLRKDVFLAIPESKSALSYAPMVVLNPPGPIVRGGVAKRYAADLLKIPYETVHSEIITQLIRATNIARKEGAADRASVLEALLPFDAGLVYEGGEPPNMLRQFSLPAWITELLEYQQVRIGWVDVRDVLRSILPRSLVAVTKKPFDEESWVLAVTHNVRVETVELLEHHGIALRQRKRNRQQRRLKQLHEKLDKSGQS